MKNYYLLQPLNLGRNILLCAVILPMLAITAFAQPQYVQVGTLPISTASERAEVFDVTTGTLLSFPYYNSGDLTSVYSTQPGSTDSFSWTPTTSFQPARTTYWGRGASDGNNLYFSGTIDSVSMFASIGANGMLGSWQPMTPLPTPAGGTGRSLHQTFIYQGRLYVLGGWHGDGQPLYSDVYYAPIMTGGALGSFIQTTSMPLGMCGHSATVSASGMIYVAYGTNLFLAQIAADGSVGSWVTQPTIAGMNHNNYGNTAMTVVNNQLVIVDYSSTFICQLNNSGQVSALAATISNPAYLWDRSVYVNNGKLYVTAATGTNANNRVGNIYRLDGLPIGPRPATAVAVLNNGFVVSNSITDGGFGYTNTPSVRIIGGGGSGAQAVVVVSNGVVTAIDVLNAGSGYTNAPLVVIEPPFILNPILGIAPMSFLSFSNLTVGGVYQLQQAVQWYWTNQPFSFTATNSLYTQMIAGLGGAYRLALNPVPAQAFATAQVINGFVVGATVTVGGSGYVTTPNVNITGDVGSNALAVASISGGSVTNITIANAGIGYTNIVTVQIDPPPAAAVFPTVQPVMRVDASSLAPYDNYQMQFKPTLGVPWGNWNGGFFTTTGVTNSQFIFITNGIGFFRLQYVP